MCKVSIYQANPEVYSPTFEYECDECFVEGSFFVMQFLEKGNTRTIHIPATYISAIIVDET